MQQLPGNTLVFSLEAPNAVSNTGYAWYKIARSGEERTYNAADAIAARNIVSENMHYIIEKEGLSELPVYMIGFSQGGIMSYYLTLSEPSFIAGAAIMSGKLTLEARQSVQSKELSNHKPSFLINHGTADNVLKLEEATSAAGFLDKLNVDYQLKLIEGMPHTINDEAMTNLLNWLEEKI